MKKITVFLFLILFGTASAAAQRTKITKFEGKTIIGLVVSGAFDVKLSQGSSTGVRVEVEVEAADKLTYELTDEGYVRLGYGSDMSKYFTSNKNRPVAYITVSRLEYLFVSGNCTVLGESVFTCEGNFAFTASGASFCDQLIVQGKAGANISVSGAAKVEKMKIECTERLLASISGTSKLVILGSTPESRLSASGASNLHALGFSCPDLQVSSTGSSMLKIHISQKADVTTGGLGVVRYTGSGQITGSGAKPL